MPPPGAYARHRAPHPLQQQTQQQTQYPSYQPSADGMYGMSDQHVGGLGNIGDLGGWGAPTNSQAAPYPTAAAMGYGHQQSAQQVQRQSQSQTPAAYRQHMSAYSQQDPQKMQFPGQQGMLPGIMQQQNYSNLGQQQSQTQQRVPQQHYSQSAGHPMYPTAPQSQATSQPYAPYGPSATIQHQPGRPAQHVSYGHSQLDPTTASYQHMSSAPTPSHLIPGAQAQSPMPNQQNHLNQSHISSIAGQPQSQIHPNVVVHPPTQQQQTHPVTQQAHGQNHSQHSAHVSLGGLPQQTTQVASQNIQQPQLTPLGHSQQQQPQSQHPSMLHSGKIIS